jgi:hypothetical protein
MRRKPLSEQQVNEQVRKALRPRTNPMAEAEAGLHTQRVLRRSQAYLNRKSVQHDDEATRRVQRSKEYEDIRDEVTRFFKGED